MANDEAGQPQAGETGTGVVTDPKPATFPPLETKHSEGSIKNLDFILDIPMQVTVQLGSTKMLIRDLLQLGQGSVVELEKLAGEPLEVLVNHQLVARGEVVVVNEKFGIRLTDVVSAVERIQHLT
jgi:flagellar motor switch protein FliN